MNEIPETFGGPSIYFHNRAIEYSYWEFLSVRHLEYVYATLVSWGMHRMGNTKTKLFDFNAFCLEIWRNKAFLEHCRYLSIDKLTILEFNELLPKLVTLCFSMKLSVSDSKIVANTKALAHILPNLIPPMDRRYTISFFYGDSASMNLSIDKEQAIFHSVMGELFQFSHDVDVVEKIGPILYQDSFSDSIPKIFDNLIISCLKIERDSK